MWFIFFSLILAYVFSQLAHALVDHETLDLEEVKKVVKGEPIRTITEVLDEEISNLNSESS